MLAQMADEEEITSSEDLVVNTNDSNPDLATPPVQIDPLILIIRELHTLPSIDGLVRYGQQVGHELTALEAQAVLGLLTEIGGALRLLARIVTGLENVTEKTADSEPRGSVWSDAFAFEPSAEATLGQQIEMARLLFPSSEKEILKHAAAFYGETPEPPATVPQPSTVAEATEAAQAVSLTALRWPHSGNYL
jgi:hypothetical protein